MLSIKNVRVLLTLGLFSTIYGQQNTEAITIGKNEKYELKESLKPGTVIVINGTITKPQFDINFTPDLGKDIYFHISIRTRTKEIVFDSYNNKWETQVRTKEFPTGFNNVFKIDIVCGHHFYEISMNGIHLAHFPYRYALADVKFIRNIDYDEKYTITFQKPLLICTIDKDCIMHLQTDEI